MNRLDDGLQLAEQVVHGTRSPESERNTASEIMIKRRRRKILSRREMEEEEERRKKTA